MRNIAGNPTRTELCITLERHSKAGEYGEMRLAIDKHLAACEPYTPVPPSKENQEKNSDSESADGSAPIANASVGSVVLDGSQKEPYSETQSPILNHHEDKKDISEFATLKEIIAKVLIKTGYTYKDATARRFLRDNPSIQPYPDKKGGRIMHVYIQTNHQLTI